MIAEHLTPREAKRYVEHDRAVTVAERASIDTHLVRCGECGALISRLSGFGPPRTEEEAQNILDGRRPR